MKQKERELKRIAENHYYTGKPLTYAQYDALKDTKYASKMTKPSVFKNLVEGIGKEPEAPRKRQYHGMIGLDKRTIRNLVDDIEDNFGLEVCNSERRKYSDVDISELRDFVSTWSARNVMDDVTQKYIDDSVISGENVQLLLAKLSWACI
jgi:hypothetical protein